MVAAGSLPPVEERLPASPLVIPAEEEIGQYGGTWRQIVGDDGMGWWLMTNYVEPWLKWKRDASGMIPNLLENWEWNDDATELVISYKKGIVWSDQEPYTCDSYMFWWDDLVNNEEVPIREPAEARAGGELMTVEKVDDYTVKFSFAVSNPLFMDYHARGYRYVAWYMAPMHYLKQFHPAYNDALGAAETDELVDQYNNRHHYPEFPTINAWKLTEFHSGERATWERNPFYWKTDPEGNQLPYVDGADIQIVQEWREIVAMKSAAGELDCQVRDFDLKDVPMLRESAEAGDYRVVLWERGDFGWPALILGYDYPDEAIVDLMYDQRFRQALSWAINRPRINDIVSLGLAVAKNAALSRNAPEFQTPEGQEVYKEWAESYATYDPAKAKDLLDQVGVVDENGDGWRQRPDGDELELIVDIQVTDQKSVDAADFVKEDWEAIGLKTTLNVIDGSLLSQRAEQGEYMIWARGSNAAWGLVSAAAHWAPIELHSWAVCPRCGLYYQTGGREGIPPRPGSMLEKLQDAYTELIQTVDDEERTAKLLDAYRIHIDDGPIIIGVIGEHKSPCVVKNNFRNFPDFGVPGPWDLGYPGSSCPEQFFFKA
jgi:peptide/nickel transport system substrate-binding protein